MTTTFFRKGLLVALCNISLLILSQPAFAEEKKIWDFDLDLTLGTDDNLTQAERERDRVEDNFASFSGGIAHTFKRGILSALTLRGFAEFQKQEDIETLDRRTVGGSVIYRFQNRLGFRAPFYQLSLTTQVDDFDVRQRDSTLYTAQAFFTRRLTDRITTSGGLEHRIRDSEGTVFDTRQNRIFANVDYGLSRKIALYLTYSLAKGDTTSTALNVVGDTSFNIVQAAEAVEPDEAFNSIPGNWIAYRLDAVTNVFNIGSNITVAEKTALDLSLLAVKVDGDLNNDYERLILRASLLTRF